jgi:hypothetical protein
MLPLPTVTWQRYDSTASLPGFNLSDLSDGNETVPDWPAYVADYPTEWHPQLEAIRQAIITTKVWAGGDWHQYNAHGVPVLSDGHFMGCTWRDWGHLLAAVWNSELGEHFTYLDFYMDRRLPERPGAWVSA